LDTTTKRKDDAAVTSTHSSTVARNRTAAPSPTPLPRARCLILITSADESIAPPADLLNALDQRHVETRAHTRPAEALTEIALDHIETDADNATRESKAAALTIPIILILVDSPDNPDTGRLLSAIDHYFPAVVVWSYRQHEKPRFERLRTPDEAPSTNKKEPNHSQDSHLENTSQPTESPVSNTPRPSSVQLKGIPEEAHVAESFRFEDHIKKPQQPSPAEENQLDEDQNRNLDDTDEFFAPPNFDSDHCDRITNDDLEVEFADDRGPAHDPGYVSEEELAMLLGDGDFLFTDDDPDDETSHHQQERDGGNRHD